MQDTPTLIGEFLNLLKVSPEIWEYYFQEVLTTKVDPKGILGKNVFLIKYVQPFQRITEESDCLHHLIDFHIHLYVHRLDILRVERALKPLTFFSNSQSLTECESPLDVEHRSNLSAYIVNQLYDFACTLNSSQIKVWLSYFHKVVSNYSKI